MQKEGGIAGRIGNRICVLDGRGDFRVQQVHSERYTAVVQIVGEDGIEDVLRKCYKLLRGLPQMLSTRSKADRRTYVRIRETP